MGAESVSGVAKHPLGFRSLCSKSGEDEGPYLEYAIHEGNGFVVCGVVWVGFVWFVDEFRGTNAPFFWRVAMFCHDLEE